MSDAERGPPRAIIFGCAGPKLTDEERDFFRDVDPLGFILFARNIDAGAQVRVLTQELRATIGRADAPILIDQEGGSVARLTPPEWREAPAAARFGALAERDLATACEAARLNARLIATELFDLGISVDCAPVLDLLVPGAHGVIGDRAFAGDPELVASLGRATCEGLLAGGVTPVIKHLPGHGRATVDSHHDLPVVTTPAEVLEATDFKPFVALGDMPWAMTAHVVYTAFDPTAPATHSMRVIDEVIRGRIGFEGFLISDDITMGALRGGVGERVEAILEAGCDAVLHCDGNLADMREAAAAATPLDAASVARLARAADRLGAEENIDFRRIDREVDTLIECVDGS